MPCQHRLSHYNTKQIWLAENLVLCELQTLITEIKLFVEIIEISEGDEHYMVMARVP